MKCSALPLIAKCLLLGALAAICVSSDALALSLPLGARQDSSQAPAASDSNLDQAWKRLSEGLQPPVFGERDAAEAGRLSDVIDQRRRALLAPGADPSAEELAAASAELRPAYDRLAELTKKRKTWAAYQANPDGDWRAELAPTIPELSAAPAATPDTLDLFAFYQTVQRLHVFEYFLVAPGTVTPGQHSYAEPAIAEALQIAQALEPFARGRLVLGGQGGYAGGQGSYQLRASYLRGRALAIAAFLMLNEGRDAEAYAVWRKSIDMLHDVERIFKLAQKTGTDTNALGQLSTIDPVLLQRLRDADTHDFAPLEWDSRSHRIGIAPGGSKAQTTHTDVAQLLQEICPWSPPVFALLEDLGQLEGLDLRVLRGPTVGATHRRAMEIANRTKLWVSSLGPSAIPPNVRADMDELRSGIVPGTENVLEWHTVRGAENLTVWVVSPVVRDLSPGDYLSMASLALTATTGGVIAIVADLTGNVLGKVADHVSPGNTAAQLGLGVGAESIPYEVVLGKDGMWGMQKQSLNPVGMVKGFLLSALSMLEEAEIEALFDGLDPGSVTYELEASNSTSYAGGWMAPVILRASVAGWERTEETQYARLRLYTRYWVLDPSGLAGEGKPFDLTSQLVDELPGAAALRGGNVQASANIWRALPWADLASGWGSRARTISLQPMTQTLRVSVAPELEKEWRADCPDDQILAVVLRYPPPYQERVDVVPLGSPFRFADPTFARQEEPLPDFTSARLFAAYDAHIVRAPVDLMDSPNALELARFPLRLTGKEITGKLIVDKAGKHAELTYEYEERLRKQFALDPEPSGKPLFPASLDFKGPYRESGRAYTGTWSDGRLEFSVAFAPAQKGTWYRVDIQVFGPNGQVGPTYQLNDRCRDDFGAAIFRGKVPVPFGASKVKAILVGEDAPAPIVVDVERERPSDWKPVDRERALSVAGKCRQERDEATKKGTWLYYHFAYLNCKIGLAREYAEIEQWAEARAALQDIEGDWLNVLGIEEEKDRDTHQWKKADYNKILANVAFHQGDAKAMGTAGVDWLLHQWQETEEDIIDHGLPKLRYYDLSVEYAEFMDDYFSIGGGEMNRHLLEKWFELRRLSDYVQINDNRRFQLGEGVK